MLSYNPLRGASMIVVFRVHVRPQANIEESGGLVRTLEFTARPGHGTRGSVESRMELLFPNCSPHESNG